MKRLLTVLAFSFCGLGTASAYNTTCNMLVASTYVGAGTSAYSCNLGSGTSSGECIIRAFARGACDAYVASGSCAGGWSNLGSLAGDTSEKCCAMYPVCPAPALEKREAWLAAQAQILEERSALAAAREEVGILSGNHYGVYNENVKSPGSGRGNSYIARLDVCFDGHGYVDTNVNSSNCNDECANGGNTNCSAGDCQGLCSGAF